MSKKFIFVLKFLIFVIVLVEVVIFKVFRFYNIINIYWIVVRKIVVWWVFFYVKKWECFKIKIWLEKINFEIIFLFVDIIILFIISNFILLIGGVLKYKFFKVFYW